MKHTHLAQYAIDAIPNPQEVRFGFEVYVRGTAQRSVSQQCVHQAHNRVAVAAGVLCQAGGIDGAGLELVKDAVDGKFMAIKLLDRGGNLSTAGKTPDRLNLTGEQGINLVAGDDVAWVGTGNEEFTRSGIVADRK
jgi:hypothetical protein